MTTRIYRQPPYRTCRCGALESAPYTCSLCLSAVCQSCLHVEDKEPQCPTCHAPAVLRWAWVCSKVEYHLGAPYLVVVYRDQGLHAVAHQIDHHHECGNWRRVRRDELWLPWRYPFNRSLALDILRDAVVDACAEQAVKDELHRRKMGQLERSGMCDEAIAEALEVLQVRGTPWDVAEEVVSGLLSEERDRPYGVGLHVGMISAEVE